MKAYISMPKGTSGSRKSLLAAYVYKILNVLDDIEDNWVTWWKEDEAYTLDTLEKADKIYIYIPRMAFHTDNGLYCYVGKGQSSEIDYCIENNKDFTFIVYNGVTFDSYKFAYQVPEDYNDWKKKYVKVWLDPETGDDLPQEEVLLTNKMLLLCL